MENKEPKNIKKIVLEGIKNGGIKKIPKFIFSLKGLLFILVIVIVLSFVLFLTSFIIYALQVSDLWYLPKFGLKGVELLFGNFPWILILIVLFFIIVLEFLVNRYSFSYRHPLLDSAVAIIFVVVIISFFIRQTSVHEKIYGDVKENGPSIIKSFYDAYNKPTSDQFHPGTIVEVNNNGFILENRDRTTTTVIVSKETKIRPGFKIYKGGKLLIVGKITNNVLQAEAIDNAPASGRP